MKARFRHLKWAVVFLVLLSFVIPCSAFALNYNVGVYDKDGTPQKVRANYAMNYVMVTRPGNAHVNSIYVRYDVANQMECGWVWDTAKYGSTYNKPAWVVRWDDDGAFLQNTSYNGGVAGWPTTGTNYGFKIESLGLNSTTFFAYVNDGVQDWEKGRHDNYKRLALGGDALLGSERNDQYNDSNYAHFWNCQKMRNASGQSYVSWDLADQYVDNDNSNPLANPPIVGYHWRQASVTNHYVESD